MEDEYLASFSISGDSNMSFGSKRQSINTDVSNTTAATVCLGAVAMEITR